MTDTIHFETEDSIAVIVIDNPPVNTGSWSVRKGLLDAVEKFAQDDALTAAVIIGKDKNFISGSDLKARQIQFEDYKNSVKAEVEKNQLLTVAFDAIDWDFACSNYFAKVQMDYFADAVLFFTKQA